VKISLFGLQELSELSSCRGQVTGLSTGKPWSSCKTTIMLCRDSRVKTVTGRQAPAEDKRQTLTFCGVILSGGAASLREAGAQSKDPYGRNRPGIPASFSNLQAAETPNISATCRL
jgi:hypothetical protein